MKYYEVAAKWWADELRNKYKHSVSESSAIKINNFESSLAAYIQKFVDKNECLLIRYEDTKDNIISKISRSLGINEVSFPKNINMMIREYNVTVYSDYQMRFEIIFRKENN